MNRDLIKSLIETFIQNGKAMPILPATRRDEAVDLLTRMMVDRKLLNEYRQDLDDARLRLGVDGALLDIKLSDIPIEDVILRGPSILPDDQLADLLIRPVALTCLYELIQEMLDANKAGEIWWHTIDEQETPAVLAESLQRTIERLKILDAIDDEQKRVLPIRARGIRPEQSQALRWIGQLTAIAASLIVGLSLGRLAFRGEGSGKIEVLLASAAPKFGTTRGAKQSLFVDVASVRPGFATLVTLAPDRPQQVFPEPGDPPLRAEPSAPHSYGPLPRDSTSALLLITETPATKLIRDALLSQEFRAADLDRLDSYLRKLLAEAGYRWVGMSFTLLTPRETK